MVARIENSSISKIAVSPGLQSTLSMKQNGTIFDNKNAF